MPANPNGFEHWRRGQPPAGLAGKASSGTQEYWRRGQGLRLLSSVATAALARVRAYFVG